MGDRLTHHLGLLDTIDGGQWCSDPVRHRFGAITTVHVCCPACKGVHEIEPSRIARDGGVVPIWNCETATCSFRSFLILEGWGEAPEFDVSDVRGKA